MRRSVAYRWVRPLGPSATSRKSSVTASFMLNFSTLSAPCSVWRSVIPSNRSPVMVTLEPVSFDGVWPTFGRLGSAAIRGKGLPGSTLPGFAGSTLPGLPGAGHSVDPGRVAGLLVGAADPLAVGVGDGVSLFLLLPLNRSPIPSKKSVMMLPSRVGLALGDGVGVAVGALAPGVGGRMDVRCVLKDVTPVAL